MSTIEEAVERASHLGRETTLAEDEKDFTGVTILCVEFEHLKRRFDHDTAIYEAYREGRLENMPEDDARRDRL